MPHLFCHIWYRRLAAVLVSIILVALCIFLFTRNSDFPADYHPDEKAKARQLMGLPEAWNYHHPLLMMEAAKVVCRWSSVSDDTFAVIRAGRLASAILASIAVISMAAAAYASWGLVGLAFCGLAMALCPPLLVHAHYFKEDTALVAGMGIALLAARLTIGARTPLKQAAAILLLGIGCGVAIAGKMIGVGFAVPSLLAICLMSGDRLWIPPRTVLFLAAGVITFVAINARAFERFIPPTLAAYPRAQLSGAIGSGVSGDLADVRMSVPNLFSASIVGADVAPLIWVALIIGLFWSIRTRRVTKWGIVVSCFVLTILVILSYGPTPFARYALPLTVCTYFAAASLGIEMMVWLAAQHSRWMWPCAALLFLCIISECVRSARFTHGFHDDSRQRLRVWIAGNLPPSTRLVADKYTCLGGAGDSLRFPDQPSVQKIRISVPKYAADVASSLDELSASGVEYVAVVGTAYEVFFAPRITSLPNNDDVRIRRQQFYKQLFSRGIGVVLLALA